MHRDVADRRRLRAIRVRKARHARERLRVAARRAGIAIGIECALRAHAVEQAVRFCGRASSAAWRLHRLHRGLWLRLLFRLARSGIALRILRGACAAIGGLSGARRAGLTLVARIRCGHARVSRAWRRCQQDDAIGIEAGARTGVCAEPRVIDRRGRSIERARGEQQRAEQEGTTQARTAKLGSARHVLLVSARGALPRRGTSAWDGSRRRSQCACARNDELARAASGHAQSIHRSRAAHEARAARH
jgi:hypothetical protein